MVEYTPEVEAAFNAVSQSLAAGYAVGLAFAVFALVVRVRMSRG